MWDYQYTSPSPDELVLRRQQLNAAGWQAWLSPIAILLAVCSARLLLAGQLGKHTSSRPPTPLELHTRRLAWLLNTTYLPEFGPLHIQLLLGAIYFGWLIYLAARNTTNDYLHLTKSLGHVAVSQLPLQYLLAVKSPKSPITLLTGLTHERLNAYHRLFGRIVHALLAGHAILYLKFFIDKGFLAKRIGDWDVRLGIVAFWSFNFLGLLALPPVRRRAYHALFYRSHVLLTALVLVVLWLHVPYTRVYVGQAAVFWVVNGAMRWRGSADAEVQIVAVGGKGGELMKINARTAGGRSLRPWVPGQHVYLRVGDMLAERKNPFTIVEVGPNGKDATLIVRKLAGTTARLHRMQTFPTTAPVKLEGPYGEAAEYLPGLLNAGKRAGQIVLVAGGVGATYTVPIYLALLRARGDTSGVTMLWFVKQATDADWAADLLKRAGKPLDVVVYATQEPRSTADTAVIVGLNGITLHALGRRPSMSTVLEPLLAAKTDAAPVGGAALVDGNGGRGPRGVKKNHDPLTVMVCGPPGLAHSLRRAVGRHVLGYGRDVRWFEEQFGFGGS